MYETIKGHVIGLVSKDTPVRMYHTGSRAICPEAARPNSDWDVVLFCENVLAEERWSNILRYAGFHPRCEPRYIEMGETVLVHREGRSGEPVILYGSLEGVEVNVLLKRSRQFAAWQHATTECKKLHSMFLQGVAGGEDLSVRDRRVDRFKALRTYHAGRARILDPLPREGMSSLTPSGRDLPFSKWSRKYRECLPELPF